MLGAVTEEKYVREASGDWLVREMRFTQLHMMEPGALAFPLASDFRGFVGGTLSYVGDRLDAFSSAGPQRTDLPAYAKLDLHAGTTYNSWTANLYVNNVTDKRGLISGGIGNQLPYSFYYIQPRTVGLSLAKTF